MTDEAKCEMAQCDQQIEWLLGNDGTSPWLKVALKGAVTCDPVSIFNDVKILYQLLRKRSVARVRYALNWSAECADDMA